MNISFINYTIKIKHWRWIRFHFLHGGRRWNDGTAADGLRHGLFLCWKLKTPSQTAERPVKQVTRLAHHKLSHPGQTAPQNKNSRTSCCEWQKFPPQRKINWRCFLSKSPKSPNMLRQDLSLYVCMHVCIHICIRAHTYTYKCMYTYTHIYVYVCLSVCVHVCICLFFGEEKGIKARIKLWSKMHLYVTLERTWVQREASWFLCLSSPALAPLLPPALLKTVCLWMLASNENTCSGWPAC